MLFSTLLTGSLYAEEAAKTTEAAPAETVAQEPAPETMPAPTAPAAPVEVAAPAPAEVVAPVPMATETPAPAEAAAPAAPAAPTEPADLENLDFVSGEVSGLDEVAKTVTVKLYGENEDGKSDKVLTVKVDDTTDITDGEKDRDLKSLSSGTEVDVEYDPATNKATYIFVY